MHGTGDKIREVPLHPQLRTDVQLWLDERPHWPGAGTTPALLLNRRGGRLSTRASSDIFRDIPSTPTVDTSGLLLLVMVTAASVQDRDGGARALERLRFVMPSVATVWADGGYAGRLVAYALQVLRVVWVVERTLSWISRCRRLDHDDERLPEHSEAMIKWGMLALMTRRLKPAPGRRAWQPTAAAA